MLPEGIKNLFPRVQHSASNCLFILFLCCLGLLSVAHLGGQCSYLHFFMKEWLDFDNLKMNVPFHAMPFDNSKFLDCPSPESSVSFVTLSTLSLSLNLMTDSCRENPPSQI